MRPKTLVIIVVGIVLAALAVVAMLSVMPGNQEPVDSDSFVGVP